MNTGLSNSEEKKGKYFDLRIVTHKFEKHSDKYNGYTPGCFLRASAPKSRR